MVNAPKCSICGSETRLTVESQLFMDKYIVKNVKSYKCQKCGMGYTDLSECARIRRRIDAIEKKAKKPVPAGTRYFLV